MNERRKAPRPDEGSGGGSPCDFPTAVVFLATILAAKLLRQFVSELDTTQPEFGDIAGIDFATVDWEALVISELKEYNLQNGRAYDAGFEIE